MPRSPERQPPRPHERRDDGLARLVGGVAAWIMLLLLVVIALVLVVTGR